MEFYFLFNVKFIHKLKSIVKYIKDNTKHFKVFEYFSIFFINVLFKELNTLEQQ